LALPRKREPRPIGLDKAQCNGTGDKVVARRERVFGPVEPQHREGAPTRRRSEGADRVLGRSYRRARVGGEAVICYRYNAGAGFAAMLHARHDLLTDEAALVEIDAVELVHIGFVRKRVTINEIEAAARHAELNPVRLE